MIITICGSYRYKDLMIKAYQEFTDKGWIVLMPAIGCEGRSKEFYVELHRNKMLKSDAILVVDGDKEHTPYIGEDTSKEIKFAVEHNIPDMYYSVVH